MKIIFSFFACTLIILSSCPPAALYAQSDVVTSNPTNSMTAALADFQVTRLQAELAKMPRGPGRDYLAGVLANRRGKLDESIKLLNRALPSLHESKDDRAVVAFQTLADDYTKAFDYAAAAKAYAELAVLSPRKGGSDDAQIIHLLAGVKPTTISWHGPVRLKTTRSAIGLVVTELEVNGVKGEWVLDTGSNYSIVSKSFAEKLGLKALPGYAQTGSGSTGLENRLQAAVIASMQVGGATLKNVVVLIFNDRNLNIQLPKRSYQINAMLGYPVFQAMGIITFTRSGEFEAGAAADRGGTATPMYMRRLTPVADFVTNGVALPFTLDTGGLNTQFSVRYYDRFKKKNLGWKEGVEEFAGAGGNMRRRICMQPVLRLGIGDKTAVLKDASISPVKMHSGLDQLYGNVGLDVFRQFESFTFDFADMTFRVGKPIAEPSAK